MGGRGGSARLGKAAAGAQAKATQLNPKDMTAKQRAQRLKEIEAILEAQKGTLANLHGAELLRAGLENEPLLREKELLEALNRVEEKGLPKYKAGDVVRSNGITAKIVDVGADGRALAEVLEGKLGTKGPAGSFVFKPESPFANGIEKATQAMQAFEKAMDAPSVFPPEVLMFPERMTKEERETRLKEIGDKIAAQREFVHSGAATPEETERLFSNTSLIEEKQRLEKLNGIAPEKADADKPKRKATQATDERESQAASPAPTAARAKATQQRQPEQKREFVWNGIKVDGELHKASYTVYPDGTIAVYGKDYKDLPRFDGMTVTNDSEPITDYIVNDVGRIAPGSPYYEAAKAAYERQEEHRAAVIAKRQGKAAQPTDERESQAASPAPTVATPAKATQQETQEKYLLSPEEYRARSASLLDGTEAPAPTVAQAKATPQNKNSRFKYNGIKGDDGKLKLADYQKSNDGTITVTSRNHEGSLPDVSGSQKDNFQETTYHGPVNYDVITIRPGEPAYAEANAAYETGQARAEAIRTGKAKKVDEILAKISRDAEEKYQARVTEGKRIEEMSAPANTKYFDVDEEQARRGRESYSLFGYKEGSETAYYRQQVDYAFKLAAVAKEKTDDPELQARADMLAERYAKKYAEWLNEKNKIDASYPSWIVAGPANYNTRKSEKKNARLDAHFKKLDEIEGIKSEIQAVPYYKPREEKIYTVKERQHEGADKYFKIERNKDVNRLQLKFDGKPPQEQREILKKHGFRWSPTQEAWQRQLTPNAEYSIDYVIRDFNKLTDNT